MERRGFLKLLGGIIGAAVAAPQVLIPKATDAFRWKKTPSGIWVINPEWVNAPYEIVCYYAEPAITPVMFKRGEELPGLPGFRFSDSFPMRFDADHKFVSPHIQL